jgi:hypothetical protein
MKIDIYDFKTTEHRAYHNLKQIQTSPVLKKYSRRDVYLNVWSLKNNSSSPWALSERTLHVVPGTPVLIEA